MVVLLLFLFAIRFSSNIAFPEFYLSTPHLQQDDDANRSRFDACAVSSSPSLEI
jgi:hypothetical protein